MNRSSSELCFQKFLREAEEYPLSGEANVGANNDSICDGNSSNRMRDDVVEIKLSQPLDRPSEADADPGEYTVVLKKKLDMYCAAVAKSMASTVTQQESSSSGDPKSGNKDASQFGSQPSANGVWCKPTNSCSSKELCDEDEEDVEGDNKMTDNMDPANAKRMRRMLSNRESARRSRKRKQAHMNDIETEVSQLRVENSSLLKRLTDMTQKYNDASVDNRVLKADIETLRAKVKMVEGTVKTVTGPQNELYPSISDISALTMPFSLGLPDEISDAGGPAKKDVARFFHEANNNFMSPSDFDPTGIVINRAGAKKGRSNSLQRVDSLECLQKRMGGGPGPLDPTQLDIITRGRKATDKQN